MDKVYIHINIDNSRQIKNHLSENGKLLMCGRSYHLKVTEATEEDIKGIKEGYKYCCSCVREYHRLKRIDEGK